MNISMIVAMSKNYAIGYKNKIPWNIPQDLSWFKKHTINKSVIMGRLTWESIGNALPMRQNIVLTKKKMKNKNNNNVLFVHSIVQAIFMAKNKKEIMIIGGYSLYKKMLPFTNKLYLTIINKNIKGDTYFPNYKLFSWKLIFEKYHIHTSSNITYDVKFQILEKLIK